MEGGGGPVDGSDAVGLHGPQQQQREGEELPGIDVACGAQLQRLVDVLHRQIKVKGRLVAEDLVAGIAAEGRHPFGKVNDAAVGDHNALGRAGGAGGEENIHRVHVQHPAAAALQQRLVRLGGARLLQGAEGAAVGQRPGQRFVGGGVDQGLGPDLLENAPNPQLRHFIVDGHIAAAGIEYSLHGSDALGGAVNENSHRNVHCAGVAGQPGAQPLCLTGKRSKGDRRLVVSKGDFVWNTPGRGIQVFQYISLHRASTPLEI